MKNQLFLLIFLSLLLNGCSYAATTKVSGDHLVTPYGTGNINAERNTNMGIK